MVPESYMKQAMELLKIIPKSRHWCYLQKKDRAATMLSYKLRHMSYVRFVIVALKK